MEDRHRVTMVDYNSRTQSHTGFRLETVLITTSLYADFFGAPCV